MNYNNSKWKVCIHIHGLSHITAHCKLHIHLHRCKHTSKVHCWHHMLCLVTNLCHLLVIGNYIIKSFSVQKFWCVIELQSKLILWIFFPNKILTSDQQASCCSSNTQNLYLGGTWFESMPGHHLCRSFHCFP